MKTKTVIHIVDKQVVRQEVPENWMPCSVTGEYLAPEEFRWDGESYQTRTNGLKAYNMPQAEWAEYAALCESLNDEIARQRKILQKEMFELKGGTSVDDLIAQLQSVKAANPNARIVTKGDYGWEGTGVSYTPEDGYKNIYSIF